MGGLLNPEAVTKKRSTFNTNSGGPSVNLTPEQQARISGSGIGSSLGVAPPAGSNPFTLQQLSQGINDGSITTQAQVDARIAAQGYSGNTVQNRVSGAPSSPLGSAQGGGSTPSTPNLGGGSDGSNFGSVGGGYNPGGATRYDSAGNRIIGQLGGRNVITGGGVDRSAGVNNNPMSQWSQFTDPNYFMGRSEDIRKQVERQMQGTIDAINKQYEGQVRREEEAGAQDLARQRSMNLRAGLGGSDFGAANKAGVRDRTSANVRDIQANQDVAVGNAIMKIEEIANQRISMEQTATQNAFTNTMALQTFKQQQEDSARSLVKELGTAGLDMETIKTKDPDLYEKIITTSGLGEVQAEALMNSARKTAQKIDYTWQVVGDKVLGYGVDPVTGDLKQVSQDLAVTVPKNYSVSFAPDGTMMMVPDRFDPNIPASQQVITAGNYSKPEASTVNYGGYNEDQNKFISSLSDKVSKNETYKKTQNMLTYKTNVEVSLNQGTGAGDLAAINQFQKVIDEGAVTRDQDVKLIQDSQSLVNKLQTQAKKLAKGEQLSPELRSQMNTAVNSIYDAQKQALMKDPFINAKASEVVRYGVDPMDTILGEIGLYDVAEETVEVVSPDGTVGTIPASQLDEALAEGYRQQGQGGW